MGSGTRFLGHVAARRRVIEATLQGPQPHRWIQTAVGKYSASVQILDSKMQSRNTVQHIFDIQVRPPMMRQLIADIRDDEDLTELEVVKSENGHVYGSAASARCTICKEVARSRCFLASVSVTSREEAQWTVMGTDTSFAGLVGALERKRIPFEIRLKKSLEDKDLLTTRQEQILSFAFERGYFDFPKKLGLKELANDTVIWT